MLIIGSALLGVALFLVIVLATILFGAMGRGARAEVLRRTELERRAGLGGDVTQTPDPLHDRFLHA